MAPEEAVLRSPLVQGENTARRFQQMAWSFLLVILDFNIWWVDLLPNLICWPLLVFALLGIRDLHKLIPKLVVLAWMQLLLDLAQNLEPMVVEGSGQLRALLPVQLVSSGLWLVFIWLLFGVIIDIARHLGSSVLEGEARFRRRFILISTLALWMCFLVLPLQISAAILFAFLVALLLSLAMLIMVFTLIRHAARRCQPVRHRKLQWSPQAEC